MRRATSTCGIHVDAAYAAGGLMSDALRPRFRGIERADSITMDPHKWWFMPYPCGAILTRDGEAGRRAFWSEAVYIPQTDDAIEFRDHGLAGSRPFSALKLWMAMKLVGRRAYGRMAEEQVRLTERFVAETDARRRVGGRDAGRHGDSGGSVHREVARRRVAEWFRDWTELQDEIVRRVLAKRRWWISPTTTVGKRAIRVMVISYLTRWEHLEELIGALRKAASEL